MPSLQERGAHREWIGGRAITLLSHYWRDDDPVELTAAIGADWADVLEGLPKEVIQKACIQYQRDEPRRKPTPGAIYEMAMRFMPKPQIVSRAVEHETTPWRDESERIGKDRANEILSEIGFRPRRIAE